MAKNMMPGGNPMEMGLPGMASGKRKNAMPAGLKPSSGSSGKPGAKAGRPNFKSRLVKPGGMARGGAVTESKEDRIAAGSGAAREGLDQMRRTGQRYAKGGAVMAGQGSGVGRLKRCK